MTDELKKKITDVLSKNLGDWYIFSQKITEQIAQVVDNEITETVKKNCAAGSEKYWYKAFCIDDKK